MTLLAVGKRWKRRRFTLPEDARSFVTAATCVYTVGTNRMQRLMTQCRHNCSLQTWIPERRRLRRAARIVTSEKVVSLSVSTFSHVLPKALQGKRSQCALRSTEGTQPKMTMPEPCTPRLCKGDSSASTKAFRIHALWIALSTTSLSAPS